MISSRSTLVSYTADVRTDLTDALEARIANGLATLVDEGRQPDALLMGAAVEAARKKPDTPLREEPGFDRLLARLASLAS